MQAQPVSNFKSLSVLHVSLLTGQLVFGAIAYYMQYTGSMGMTHLGVELKYILIGLAVFGCAMIAVAFAMYNKKVRELNGGNKSVREKLVAYRAANLIRWAMLETPVLLAIVAFLLTGNINFLIIAGVVLLLFLMTRPTINKAATELNMSREEVQS